MSIAKDASIRIIGAGAWGLSTALHLHSSGFTNITVFDRAPKIPSTHSAAWDLNKIVRAEYEDRFYTDLALEAISGWKTPLFGPYFHQTGYVVAATGKAPSKAVEHLEKALSSIESDPKFKSGIRRLNGPKDFREYTWQYSGPLTGFRGYYNRLAGYAHSSDTLKGVWDHCASLGVKFVLGESVGQVSSLQYSSPATGEGKRCTGVRTEDGKLHSADLVICASGAQAASLIPELGHFAVGRCWSVAHVQLNDEETNLLRGIPTTNVRDLGFFFEPDPKTRLFKLCPLGAGYTNTGKDGISVPPSDDDPSMQDFIPAADEIKLRTLLRETFPWMADRPFVEKKLCWFSDTSDSEYCIDFVPGLDNSLVCLAGDSGHGFKMMPTFGKWVVELLEAGKQALTRWQWRQANVNGNDWGEAVSWRIGEGKEYSELIAEAKGAMRAKL